MKLESILANNIKRLMESTPGLDTIDKVAQRSGLGRGTVDRVRKAEVSAQIATVEMLAAAFGVPPIALLAEDGAATMPAASAAASNDSVFENAPTSMQWVSRREDRLLTYFRTTDDAGRKTIENIASIVPKVSLALARDKAE